MQITRQNRTLNQTFFIPVGSICEEEKNFCDTVRLKSWHVDYAIKFNKKIILNLNCLIHKGSKGQMCKNELSQQNVCNVSVRVYTVWVLFTIAQGAIDS